MGRGGKYIQMIEKQNKTLIEKNSVLLKENSDLKENIALLYLDIQVLKKQNRQLNMDMCKNSVICKEYGAVYGSLFPFFKILLTKGDIIK